MSISFKVFNYVQNGNRFHVRITDSSQYSDLLKVKIFSESDELLYTDHLPESNIENIIEELIFEISSTF